MTRPGALPVRSQVKLEAMFGVAVSIPGFLSRALQFESEVQGILACEAQVPAEADLARGGTGGLA